MENEPNIEAGQELDLGNEIADALRGYGEENGFDSQTCDEIAAMSFEEAFETAYGYLAQAGLGPDTVLAKFMQEPEDS